MLLRKIAKKNLKFITALLVESSRQKGVIGHSLAYEMHMNECEGVLKKKRIPSVD